MTAAAEPRCSLPCPAGLKTATRGADNQGDVGVRVRRHSPSPRDPSSWKGVPLSDHFPPTQPEPAQTESADSDTGAGPARLCVPAQAGAYRSRRVATTAVVVGAFSVVSAADDATSSLCWPTPSSTPSTP